MLKSSRLGRLLETLELVFVDIGARGGLDRDLQAIAWCTHAIGFEPAPEEAERLTKQLDQVWRSAKIFPYAIGSMDGPGTLYLTESPEAASLRPHNERLVERFGYDNLHVDKRKIPVSTRTLDSLLESQELSPFDYLKVDIEGVELEVLQATQKGLKTCSALKVECSFLEQRIGQALIWDVAIFLREQGFEIVDLHDIRHWRRRPLPTHPYVARAPVPYSKGQLAQCDIVALKQIEAIVTPEEGLRVSCLAATLGFFDYAVQVLREVQGTAELAKEQHELDLETEFGEWSRQLGKSVPTQAIKRSLRNVVPLFKSRWGGIFGGKPRIPY